MMLKARFTPRTKVNKTKEYMLNPFFQLIVKSKLTSRPLHQEVKPILQKLSFNPLFQDLIWSQLLASECPRMKDPLLPLEPIAYLVKAILL